MLINKHEKAKDTNYNFKRLAIYVVNYIKQISRHFQSHNSYFFAHRPAG